MKIAIPVKTNKENPVVSPLFGKAKWFAFIEEDGKVTIESNPIPDGQAVIRWFIDKNVDIVIMQEMGINPYRKIKEHGGIRLYHSGFERITLDEVLKAFHNGQLPLLDDAMMTQIIKHHESRHTHHGHGHEHHHHH